MGSWSDLRDPRTMLRVLWPDVQLYDKQWDVVDSLQNDDETYVVAGNELGKDFVAGFACLWFFLSRTPCRVVTTSAKADHLRVLWGEIAQFVQTAKHPLEDWRGGPLRINHYDIRKSVGGQLCPKSYIKGMVSSPDSIAAMQGHHVPGTFKDPHTMFVSDESSSVPHSYYQMAATWMHRALIFGNPWECDNFFRKHVAAGDAFAPDGKRCYRRVVRIRATDSPNVRLGLAQARCGEEPTDEVLIPGVKSYSKYVKHLAMWDEQQRCVGLDAQFYEGKELRLFPAAALAAAALAAAAAAKKQRRAVAIGCDPGEGAAETSMTAVDELGIVEERAARTPDTNVVPFELRDFARKHRVPWEMVALDVGGGGKQCADRMRAMGMPVRTVAFGGAPTAEIRRTKMPFAVRKESLEDRRTYINRRAEMFGELSEAVDAGFGVPEHLHELRRQLSCFPKKYDGEGRLKLPPKRTTAIANKGEPSLTELCGCSPDRADSLAVAYFAMKHPQHVVRAGAVL